MIESTKSVDITAVMGGSEAISLPSALMKQEEDGPIFVSFHLLALFLAHPAYYYPALYFRR